MDSAVAREECTVRSIGQCTSCSKTRARSSQSLRPVVIPLLLAEMPAAHLLEL
jgi:hypothetical protein